jgi:hypothetical protein
VTYRVFAQSDEPRLPLDALVERGRSHFEARLDVLAAGDPGRARIAHAAFGSAAVFALGARERRTPDLDDAVRAELAGQRAGMGALASRCGFVWDVAPEGEVSEWHLLEFCALLASVALGPVLPPACETLYGVRSARERAEALRLRQ